MAKSKGNICELESTENARELPIKNIAILLNLSFLVNK
jgi:hypothetical protein